MTPDPATSPIFIVGTGRSGTTLLRMMLCAHPRIHLTHEASFYVWEKKGEVLADYLPRYLNGFSFRWLRLDPAGLLDGLPEDAEHKDVYTAVMKTLADRYDKPRWGDKTPSHTANLGRIFEDYPDARVIRIVRDPRHVIRSLNRMPWGPPSRIAGSALVGIEHRQSRPFRDKILEVRLEDLLADRRPVLERVLEFVGEPFDEAVLDHTQHLPEPDDLPPVPWFQSARNPPSAPRKAEAFEPVDVRLLEFLNRAAMRDHDYAVAALDEEPGRAAVLARYLGDLPTLLRSLWILLGLWRRAQFGKDDAESRQAMRSLNPAAWERYPGFEMPELPEHPPGWEAHLPGAP